MNFHANKTYSYYDISRTKTRVVVLNTTDLENKEKSSNAYEMSEEQLNWLASSLVFKEEGWNVVILTHYCANEIGNWNYYPCVMENTDIFDSIMLAFKRKASGSSKNVKWDFRKNKSNDLVANFCGDSHFDNFVTKDGIHRIITQGYGGVSEADLPANAKKWNRGSGLIVDVVVVKPKKKEFRMFRLGAGEDRFFVY